MFAYRPFFTLKALSSETNTESKLIKIVFRALTDLIFWLLDKLAYLSAVKFILIFFRSVRYRETVREQERAKNALFILLMVIERRKEDLHCVRKRIDLVN